MRRTLTWYLDHADWVAGVRSGDYKRWVELNYAARQGPSSEQGVPC